MILDYSKKYSRINNVIYEEGIPIFRIASNLIDIKDLRDGGITYMNSYAAMYPEKIIEMEKTRNVFKMFYDLETTGTDHNKNSIHHISGIIEKNDEIVQYFDFKVRPHPKAKIEQEALDVGGVTEEQIMAYPEMSTVYKKVLVMLGTYIDRYNKTDKMWLIGFNNRNFDDLFFRKFFELNHDPYFNAWFWSDSQDAMIFASNYLEKRRHTMDSFQLRRVALELGIPVDESKLHDAEYDVELTREIYRITTGLEIEL